MKTIVCESISNFSPYIRIISYKFYEDTEVIVKKYKYVNINYNPDKNKGYKINYDIINIGAICIKSGDVFQLKNKCDDFTGTLSDKYYLTIPDDIVYKKLETNFVDH